MDEYVTQLEAVLARVLGGSDSKSIKDATDELQNVWYKRSETVPALVKLMQSHPQAEMRQISGVEVRKLIPKFWYETDNALSPELMTQIKASLLSESLGEPNDLVRHTIARVISVIASIDLDSDRWPELLPNLFDAAKSPEKARREVSTYVIYALLDSADYCSSAFENPTEMLTILSQTIKDPESIQVRVNSVLALGGLGTSLSGNEAAAFQQFVPVIVEVLGQCVSCNDEKSAIQIFESLSELIDSDSSILGPAFGELLGHMLSNYASQPSVDPEYRISAMRVVFSAVIYRYKRVQKQKLGPELTKTIVQIIAAECKSEENDEDEDDDEDMDEPNVLKLAIQTLETLAARLPPSQVITPLMQLLPDLVHTSDPSLLRAGYLAFAASADGAPDFVSSEAETLLPWIVQGLMHENSNVRVAALNALCQLGDGSQDKLVKEHATLVPLVYGIMDGARSIKVCRYATVALASIMRALSNDIVTSDYLPGLMPRLLTVVKDSDNLDLKGFIANTIGTTAEVAGRNFEPYFQATIDVLTPYLQIPPKDPASGEIPPAAAKLVSESVGTVSRLCSAVGPDMFRPYLEPWMATVMACITSDDSHLREMAPLYISEMADIYKSEMAPYIQHIVPPMFNVLEQEEIYGDFEGLDEEDDAQDGIKVNTTLCIEKEFNLDCLCSLWKSVAPDASMSPYFEESIKQFKAQSEHFYEDVRLSAIAGLWGMMAGLKTTPQFDQVKAATWEVTKEFLNNECDLAVLDSVFDIISTACREFDAKTFDSPEDIELLLENIFEVLSKSHRVFEDFDGLEDDEDAIVAGEEDSEAATLLVRTSLDLLSQVARILKADFVPLFEKFADVIKPYATSKIDQERESGIGSLADLVAALTDNLAAYSPVLLSVFGNALSDSSEGVRSVAAYGIGLMAACDQGSAEFKSSYPLLLEGIAKVMMGTDSRAISNGAGALARLALKHPEALPIANTEVASQLMVVLPLKDAFEEYPPILQYLSTCPINESAQPVLKGIWDQHIDAMRRDAVKSVSYLPADDPLNNEVAMSGFQALCKMANANFS